MQRSLFILAVVLPILACRVDAPGAHSRGREVSADSLLVHDSISVSLDSWVESEDFEYGPFDTFELSGVYRVIGSLVPDSLSDLPMEVYELRGDTLIAELTGWSQELLRYDAQDLGDFLLSFERQRGPGNPSQVALIRKNTGESLAYGRYHDVDSAKGYLLYGIRDSIRKNLGLVELRSMEIEVYEYPSDMSVGAWWSTEDGPWYYGPRIKSIDRDYLVVEFKSDAGGIRTYRYHR